MAKVSIYRKFFEKNIMTLLKPDQQKNQTKLAYYLKLYSAFIGAEHKLDTARGFDNLRIADGMTAQESFAGEVHYIKYLNSITRNIIRHRKKIQRVLKKDPVADPLHAKSHLLMAQNICVLRILKISKT